MENPDGGTERHHMENPDDGTERHHVEDPDDGTERQNPDDAPQKRNKRKQKTEAKRIECHKTWRKRIEVFTSGEALRRMQNNVFECENSMYCQ